MVINKKYILFLVLLVSLSVFVLANHSITTLKVDETNVSRNTGDVSVPIYLENNETVYGVQFKVSYDTSNLVFKRVSTTSRFPRATIESNDVSGIVSIAGVTETGISPGRDAIINLIFDTKDSGSYTLDSSEIMILDLDTKEFSTNSISGRITIE